MQASSNVAIGYFQLNQCQLIPEFVIKDAEKFTGYVRWSPINSIMPGPTPAVDTVTLRFEIPITKIIHHEAQLLKRHVVLNLMAGSPIPIITTFVTVRVPGPGRLPEVFATQSVPDHHSAVVRLLIQTLFFQWNKAAIKGAANL
ncbi:MAG: hypothetical protein ACNYPE_15465 [Candidatus Azotimanducaceae bacterium WSBS_2022_MAG_OTU7]